MSDKTEISKKTPSILIPALRQYQHNDCSGLLAGFDYEETIKIVTAIQSQFVEQACEAIDEKLRELASDQCIVDDMHAINASLDVAQQAIRDKFK